MKLSRGNKKFALKVAILILALGILTASVIGTTLAWLMDETAPVKNVFTVGKVDIELAEDYDDGDGNPNENWYVMTPGATIEKKPIVTVNANSENCWLFIKIDESANLDDFITYNVILDDAQTTDVVEGWTALGGFDGVYYRAVEKSSANQEFEVLLNNKVTVLDTVTAEAFNSLKDESQYPSLTFTAYAVQRGDNEAIDTAAEAWALAVAAQNANP